MSRPGLEVADIFRDHGETWRQANAGHVSLEQMKVMSAIESCRTAALGGHVAACENDACGHTTVCYNSCRNRHCPKCQGAAAREWMEAREAELLPVPYFHVVFTLPAAISDIAYQNKRVIYDLLFRASKEAMLTIAADPRHMGAKIGITSVLHTWGSAMTHHPHVHMIVPGGGLAPGGDKWIACRRGFFLPVRVLSKLFRGLMLDKLVTAHKAGKLDFYGNHAHLADARAFERFLRPLWRRKWFVYTKPPFGGPKAVLAYLSRYTHRIAISNSRLIRANAKTVTFRVKNYRVEGPDRYTTMTLATSEFIRRFLLHVLPKGQHRIRHYGLFANGGRADNITKIRELLDVIEPDGGDGAGEAEPQNTTPSHTCPAVAVQCVSSRCSKQVCSHGPFRRQSHHQRGSTAHDTTLAANITDRPAGCTHMVRQQRSTFLKNNYQPGTTHIGRIATSTAPVIIVQQPCFPDKR